MFCIVNVMDYHIVIWACGFGKPWLSSTCALVQVTLCACPELICLVRGWPNPRTHGITKDHTHFSLVDQRFSVLEMFEALSLHYSNSQVKQKLMQSCSIINDLSLCILCCVRFAGNVQIFRNSWSEQTVHKQYSHYSWALWHWGCISGHHKGKLQLLIATPSSLSGMFSF